MTDPGVARVGEPSASRESGTERAEQESGRSALRAPGLDLILVSFVILFQELALIRWIPSQVRVAAYFPNLILISAFLGLGIGCLRSRSRSLLWLWPFTVLSLVGISVLLGRIAFTANDVSEHLWLLYFDLPPDAPVVEGVRAPLITLFILTATSFVPLGQVVARRLKEFRRGSNQLWGYSLDLSGSLLGVIAFAVVSFLGTFPVVWFSIFLLTGTALMMREGRHRAATLCAALAIVGTVWATESNERYSPYYAISTESVEGVPIVRVMTNGSLHQVAKSLRKSDPLVTERDLQNRRGYHYPYEQLRDVPERVLVLGAGTGNDVAVLLDQGVRRIDVVEIDPVILDLGRLYHPNRPYDSPRVELINTDARSFLNDTDRTYDLIVFGTLDSMTRLSALSNIRLDNFVYTVEGIRAAKSRLAPGGGLVMYFMAQRDHVHRHLYGILASVFGEVPAVQWGDYLLFNVIYMAGPAFAHLATLTPEDQAGFFKHALPSIDLPTDDWPYLYLESRSVSPFYLSLLAVFLLLALVGVLWASKEMRATLTGAHGIDVEMFLFGLGFLLLETQFVTAMNLVWGATWLTSAVVFGSILGMILLATVLTKLAPLPWHFAAAGLIASLLVVYVLPIELLVGRSPLVRLGLSVAFVGTPIFFASACFALSFKVRKAVDIAFGWNLLGAVAGGLIEFFSMFLGLRTLVMIAAVAYLGIFVLRERSTKRYAQVLLHVPAS